MTLLDFFLVYRLDSLVSVYELGGAPVIVRGLYSGIPYRFLDRKIVSITPDHYCVCVVIEGD